MCGIAGALLATPDAPLHVLGALRRLEYRGYDSAGIAAVAASGDVERRRAEGKLDRLAARLDAEPLTGSLAIGHTRWATHGPAVEANAHPHRVGAVTVVHNGIIDNHDALAAAAGWNRHSETDTEAIAAALDAALRQGATPEEAMVEVQARMEGMYALLVLIDGHPDRFWCARRGSPLALGRGEKGLFAGSDAIALAGLADGIAHLHDGDWGVVARDGIALYDAEGAPRPVRFEPMPISASAVEKAGHRHFMSKEIAEQPIVLADAIKAHRRQAATLWGALDPASCTRLEAYACGTAALAAEVARFWFEGEAGLPMGVTIASEARHRPLLGAPTTTWSMAVSQSGETADTMQALRAGLDAGRPGIAVVNVETSSMARAAGTVVPIHAGPEIGVASTKAFTAQLLALRALALTAAAARGRLDAAGQQAAWEEMERMPALMAAAIASLEGPCAALGADLAPFSSALFLGRGTMAPLASEAALKLKEISYIHAEGYAAGELKHGPIALIDDRMPVVVFAPSGPTFAKTQSAVHEVRARGGKVVLVSDAAGIEAAGEGCWRTLLMPSVPEAMAPLLYALPAQMLAYHTAVAKGTDVDQPRNLAKSVTVE